MSQSHYHVYLPPTLSPLQPPIPRLSIKEINVPRDVESQFDFGTTSQLSRLKRVSQNTQTQSTQSQVNQVLGDIRHASLMSSGHDAASIGGSRRTLKRKSSNKDLAIEPDLASENADVKPDRSERGISLRRSRAPLTLSGISTDDGPEDVDGSLGERQEISGSGPGSRRRSARISRGGSGLIGTLPFGFDTTNEEMESYLSLNTTISTPNASQLPPSADQSSVLNLPRWSIPLSKLSSLPTLLKSRTTEVVSVIVCVLSVETPVLRKRKMEKVRGEDGTLWIGGWRVTAPVLAIGYEPSGGGEGCSVKLWDGWARDWGDERVRKGDVILLENVTYKPPAIDPAQITISSTPTPKITILYRTLPRYSTSSQYVYTARNDSGAKVIPEDRLLRPDLRLGRSDLGVRKVGEIVRWFSGFIGGDVPS